MHFILVLTVTHMIFILISPSQTLVWQHSSAPTTTVNKSEETQTFILHWKMQIFFKKQFFQKISNKLKCKTDNDWFGKLLFGRITAEFPFICPQLFLQSCTIQRQQPAASITPHLWTPLLAPTGSHWHYLSSSSYRVELLGARKQ